MAQLVLGTLGSQAGASLLPNGFSLFGTQVSGAAIGQAVGSLAGAAIDARYLAPPVEGPRVQSMHLTESREGAGVPVVYGRVRVGGQVIWAARFAERRDQGGGKGGPRVNTYSYTLSFAVGLCEGEVSRVTRCWANGQPYDLSQTTWRLYRGTEDQQPDPLIEAVEGAGLAPAYRGLAYIVFEDMPVDSFGARLPQMSFEVVRPAGGGEARLESVVRAVNIIPGAGEFSLATDVVRRVTGPGMETPENQHGAEARADFEISLDQLEAELPEVSRVNLVVGWFGDDLRCGVCRIRPGVDTAEKVTAPWSWSVGGAERAGAHVVSQTDGRANYGGTPADAAVKQAVAALQARGYHVTLYPFLFMDIPEGNGLPDPHGGDEQSAFPWRGRIAVEPGDVEPQVEAFFGGGDGYRAFILHYAGLAAETGADGLLIGSEMIGLTHARDGEGRYPAVAGLKVLANDARAVVGPDVELSYAADWTEYGAHVSGADVSFPLDELWADEAITYVGLDWYAPMADWRDSAGHLDEGFGDGRSRDYLDSHVEGGEAYDWYYADDAGRVAQDRLPITDGAHGEPWVFRQKDIRNWWASEHHARVDGVRSGTPTAWFGGMKPVRFVETGCPGVDKGANQPNVFFDPKSSESALPHYSDGSRDHLIQRRVLETLHAHWAGEPMIPADGIALWAWDARPYPAFPLRDDIWSDGDNWRLGHWLNGRTGMALLPDVVADICGAAGADADTDGLTGIVSGYGFDGRTSARRALDPLMLAYGVDAVEDEGRLPFRMRVDADVHAIEPGQVVLRQDRSVRGGMEAPEVGVLLRFADDEADQLPGIVSSEASPTADRVVIDMPVAMDRDAAQRLANSLAEEATLARERLQLELPAAGLRVEAGDLLGFGDGAYRVVETSLGDSASLSCVRSGPGRAPVLAAGVAPAGPSAPFGPAPDIVVIDAPPLQGQEADRRPVVIAFSDPWTGPVTISAGAGVTQLRERCRIATPGQIGRLIGDLYPHASGRWQQADLWVSLPSGGLQSRPDLAILNGANMALVETAIGWEAIQFATAELMGEGVWKLSRLLRGQQGTEAAMATGAAAGARIVFLSGDEPRLDLAESEAGLEIVWRAWRSRPDEASAVAGLLVWRGAGGRMWAPVQLRATWLGDDIRFDWIRRSRLGGDGWDVAEPLLETAETYRISVRVAGNVVRSWTVTEPAATYPLSWRALDLPSGGLTGFEICQIGPGDEPGYSAVLELFLPTT